MILQTCKNFLERHISKQSHWLSRVVGACLNLSSFLCYFPNQGERRLHDLEAQESKDSTTEFSLPEPSQLCLWSSAFSADLCSISFLRIVFSSSLSLLLCSIENIEKNMLQLVRQKIFSWDKNLNSSCQGLIVRAAKQDEHWVVKAQSLQDTSKDINFCFHTRRMCYSLLHSSYLGPEGQF